MFTQTGLIRKQGVVERGIGQLKRRFRVLHEEIRLDPPLKVCKVVEVCAMLHNICKDRNINLPPEEAPQDDNAAGVGDMDEDANHDVDDNQPAPYVPGRRLQEGRLYRDHFCNLYFK